MVRLTDAAIDERQLRRKLLHGIPERRRKPKMRLVMVAAAASLLAVLIGYETTRISSGPGNPDEQTVIHDPGENVILVLREGGDPIYVAMDRSPGMNGGER